MTQNSPLISIIMPTHNAATYIAETVESVLAQTYTNWELLVCDDASTDNTLVVLEPYLSDVRIRVIPLEKQPSVYRVRNIGFSHTRGEYIAFQDADDLYFPDSLQVLAETLQDNSALKAVYGFFTCMDATGKPVSNHGVNLILQDDDSYTIPVDSNHSWQSIVAGRCISVLQNIMIRRDFMTEIGPFFEEATHYADTQYILRMFAQDMDAIQAVPHYTLRYRLHDKSATKDAGQLERLLRSRIKVADWLHAQTNLPAELDAMKGYFYILTYLRTARLQLFEARPAKVWYVFEEAMRHPNMPKLAGLIQFLPLLALSLVPNRAYKLVFNAAKDAVNGYAHLMTRVKMALQPQSWTTTT